jgi:hypothetical protein
MVKFRWLDDINVILNKSFANAKPEVGVSPVDPIAAANVDEDLDYRIAQRMKSTERWRSFLAAHPDGLHAQLRVRNSINWLRQASGINSGRGRNKVPRRPLYTAFTGRRIAVAGISRGECSGSSCCELDALRGDAKRQGRRRLATEARPREQAGRNMATPQRSPLWPLVAYGALALAMLAMSERPIDAKGRPDTHRATAMPREPPDSGREIDRSRAAERGHGRQATSPRRFSGEDGRTSSGALTRR